MTDTTLSTANDSRMALRGLDPNKLRDEILRWQRHNGKSDRAFARLAEVDRSGFSRFMRGKTRSVTPALVVKYAKVIGKQVDDFYTDPAS